MLAYIQIMRPLNVLIGSIGILLGGYLTGNLAVTPNFWLAIITVITFTGAANAINDFYDFDIDKINRPNRPLPSGKIPRGHARIFAYILFGTGVVASSFINSLTFAIAFLSMILLIGYSKWWKRQPIIGNVVVSWMIAIAFFYGSAAFGYPRAAIPPAFIGFVYTWGRELIKDLEDAEGDAALAANTVPILFGELPAKILTTILFIGLIFGVLIPYFKNIYNATYFIIVLVGVDAPILYITFRLWRAKSSGEYRHLSQILKADMFVGLLAVFVGTF